VSEAEERREAIQIRLFIPCKKDVQTLQELVGDEGDEQDHHLICILCRGDETSTLVLRVLAVKEMRDNYLICRICRGDETPPLFYKSCKLCIKPDFHRSCRICRADETVPLFYKS
jgi:hypothetical protein